MKIFSVKFRLRKIGRTEKLRENFTFRKVASRAETWYNIGKKGAKAMKVQTMVFWFVKIFSGGLLYDCEVKVSRCYTFLPDKEKFYQVKADRAIWVECGSEDDVIRKIGETYGAKTEILKMVRGEVTDRIEDL